MDLNFKPYRTGMLTVKERYPCGSGDGPNGRNHVYYLCRCDCGKEVICSSDEIAKHPYSCGCTPKPIGSQPDDPQNLLGYGRQDGTQLCAIAPSRVVYSSVSKGGVGQRGPLAFKGREGPNGFAFAGHIGVLTLVLAGSGTRWFFPFGPEDQRKR